MTKPKHPDDPRVPPVQQVAQPWKSDLDKEPITGANEIPGLPNTLPTKGRRWYPNPEQIVAISILFGGFTTLFDYLSHDVVTTKLAILSFGKGVVAQVMFYAGMRSAGPKP